MVTTLAVALYGIVGGPGVGKTSIIDALREKGEETSQEVATDFILERMEDGSKEPWNENDFQYTILNRTLEREDEVMRKSKLTNKERIFTDRAVLDLYVYLEVRGKKGSEEYQKSDELIKKVNVNDRYKAIFLVLPWGDEVNDYHNAKNRHEEVDEALILAHKTHEVYSQHFPNLIKVPGRLTPKERADFVLRKVAEIEAENCT